VTKGDEAEQRIVDRLRSALPAEYRIDSKVDWITLGAGHGAPVRNGEVDVLVSHPDRGFLAIEVKAGTIRRDSEGRWFAGPNKLKRSPCAQARDSRYGFVEKVCSLPDWPTGLTPIAGWLTAWPDVDLATAGRMRSYLGTDCLEELILDGAALETNASLRRAIERAYALASTENAKARSPGEAGLSLVRDLLAGPIELHAQLGRRIREDEPEVAALTRSQVRILRQLRRQARVEIVGPAGTGKTLVACEKARDLARQGFVTLLVCFNQPLARDMADQLEDEIESTNRLKVTTFHQLCEDLAREAGTLDPKPANPGSAWFSTALPGGLLRAIETLGPRFNAIVVDEGQDFELDWLESLELLLHDPASDVLYVFHDPAQAVYRADRVASLGLARFELDEDCRNPGPIHDLVQRFYTGDVPTTALREGGLAPEVIEAAAGQPTIDALRATLHRLRHDEDVRPWEIAVLVGGSLEDSLIWQASGHRFGNEVLWNGQVDDSGRLRGLAFSEVEPQPTDTTLVDSIRRFKGLDRSVVILAELRPDDPRLEQLLYIGLSRARHHLVVIAPAPLANRLRGPASGRGRDQSGP
jgi:Nuclease-related domain/AAA domain/UvrD-like helicase C-terminal domain